MDAHTETRTMQAITQRAYGSSEVLTYGTVPRPVPKADEVLIRVRASSLNFADKAMITGRPSLVRAVSGLRRPKHPVPGKDVAGVVEEVGADVTDLQPGDEVFAEAVAGAWAQYVCVPAKLVAPKPANLTFEQAATLPLAAGTALDCVAGVQPGQKVLVNGASGGVGTFAVQAGQGARGRGDRGVQRAQRGAGPQGRGGPRHRLRALRLHQRRHPVRPDHRPGRATGTSRPTGGR